MDSCTIWEYTVCFARSDQIASYNTSNLVRSGKAYSIFPYCIGAHDMTVLLYTIMLSRSAIDILAKTAAIVAVNCVADKLAKISKAVL